MRLLAWLERHFEEVVCCIGLTIIAVCVFLQVVFRYVFGSALHWTEEVAAIAMVWSVYMGAALCVRERFHIRIIVAVTALPTRLARMVIIMADLFWAFFCLFMIRVAIEYLEVLWRFTARSPSLGIDQFYPQSILVIGYSLILLRLIQLYVNWFRDGAQGLPGMLLDEDDSYKDAVERAP